MSTLRLLQISDCHLLAEAGEDYKGWNTYRMLQQLLAQIRQREQDYSAILLTGDMSQHGDSDSYRRLIELFSFCNKPIYALPGNHDEPKAMAPMLDGSNIRCAHSADFGSWQVLLLNSRVANEPAGFIESNELDKLRQQLDNSQDKPSLIAVHHHPLPVGSDWMDALILQNGTELLQTLAPYPQVKAVIFGHVHQAFDQRWRHIRLLGCPSSCFQFKPGEAEFSLDDLAQGYRWLELGDDGQLNSGIIRLGE